MRTACLLLLMMLAAPASAEVYRYVDEQGVVHYTDKPPGRDAKPATLPPLHTYPAGRPPEPDAPSAPETPASAGKLQVRIDAPAPDQTFRDPSGSVSVSASVSPALPGGHGLIYYVDGSAATPEPVQTTGFTLSGLERGEHRIAVAVVDGDGREVARSATVSVHLKPPTVRRPAQAGGARAPK